CRGDICCTPFCISYSGDMNPMQRRKFITTLACAAVLSTVPLAAQAANNDTIKVGLVAPFSGPFAQYGTQMYAGIQAYMLMNGDEVAGKKIELIRRDTAGAGTVIALRLSQELVTRDQVDFLTGYGLTPEA